MKTIPVTIRESHYSYADTIAKLSKAITDAGV
jgi:hypothetical protein